MKIVLSTSPHIKHSSVLESDFDPQHESMYDFAPLGLLMLISIIRQELNIVPNIYDINQKINSHEIEKNDFFYQNTAISICNQVPDILGFMTECDSYHHVLQICQQVKKIKPNCKIVLGGPHATAVAKETMEQWDCIDYIVLGEGEFTFVEIVKNIKDNKNTIISGSIFRDEYRQIIIGPSRHLVESLDMLPYPAYDLYSSKTGEELFLEVGRGCPFDCTFCSTSPFWQRKHRVKSPQRIVEEIKYIRKYHNTTRFHFTHDLFTTNEQWVRKVCLALIESNSNIKWTCSSRVDTINEALIELMSQAGCNAIYFGVESGSDRILKLIDKKISFDKTIKILELCKKYNINANAGLIIGFPHEDNESIKNTFDAYLKMLIIGAKPIHIFSFCPFAQSSIYQELKEMTCTGHFLDIPISKKIDSKNRKLIKGNISLFGSYFRPRLKNVRSISAENISAVDEFSILVDTIKLPSIIIANVVNGGMKTLFVQWIKFITQKNKSTKKASSRKYFGSPIDFCDFLLNMLISNYSDNIIFIRDIIEITKKNLYISTKYKYEQPLTMENYRSKIVPFQFDNIDINSNISTDGVIDYYISEYDITDYLGNENQILNFDSYPKKKKVNFVWHINNKNTISLITVNDFILYLIKETKQTQNYPLQSAILNWINTFDEVENQFEFPNLLKDLKIACENNLLQIA